MRRRFWQFVHDQLERSWHWVYYHKLEPERAKHMRRMISYNYTYVYRNSETGKETPVAPIR